MKRLATVLLAFLTLTSAQLLTDGNSQLPSCASSCQLLTQAAEACGGTTSANQQIWSCFCQSSYLTTLYDSDTGICDSTCTSASDSQQVSTWYKSNCGSDNGASEHADTGAAVTSSSSSASAVSTVASSTSGAAAAASTTAASLAVDPSAKSNDGSWWSTHYRWVVMLIVLFIGLSLLAVLAVWLKRRHDRRADQIRHGFNAGITERSAPVRPSRQGTEGTNDSAFLSNTQMSNAGMFESSNGRNSPARTREAFMPYGYNYTRSESRLASRTDVDRARSPLARDSTPARDMDKEVGSGASPESLNSMDGQKRGKRVLVRERSVLGPESPGMEEGKRLG